METEEYENVLNAVRRSGDWALYTILKDTRSLEHRAEKIKEVFQTACNENDDKLALRYFSWFLKAVDDANLLDFVNKDNYPEELPYSNEVDEAKLDAQAAKVRMTMKLYNGLPTSGVDQAREFIAEDESRLVNVDIPILLKTKRTMLTEVAEWWRTTKDEEESDKIFNFLCQIPTQFEEEEKIRLSVIRKATNFGFPVPRLTRQLLSLAPHTTSFLYGRSEITSKIALILAIARTRNKEEKELFQELMVMQHLQGCSKGAFQFLESIAKQLAIFDADARELKEIMQPTEEIGFAEVNGKIEMSYEMSHSDVKTLTVLIKRICSPIFPISFDAEKKLYKKEFEVARKIVSQWKKKHSERNVKLVLTVKEGHNKSLKPIFSMNRTF